MTDRKKGAPTINRSAKLAMGLWVAAVGGSGAIGALALSGGRDVTTIAIALAVILVLAGLTMRRMYIYFLTRQMEWRRKYGPPDA